MNDLNELMDETHEHYQGKFDRLHQESLNLRRANTKLKNEVRALKRVIHKLKQADKEKQHYRNGQKRGRTRNG